MAGVLNRNALGRIESTWKLFWNQSLGRALAVVFAVLAAIYLFEIGPDVFRNQISIHIDRLFLPGLITLLVLRTRSVKGVEERRFWDFIILGMVVWLAGSVLNFLVRPLGLPRWADLATDVFYIGLFLSWVLASDQQPQLEDGWSSGDVLYRFSLVAATLFIVIMFGYFVVVPWAVHPSENAHYFASFNLYVTLDILLAVKFTLLFNAARSVRWRRTFALMAGVAIVMAAGDLFEGLGWANMLNTVVGGRIDVIWLVPHFLLSVMILTCTEQPAEGDGVEAGTAPRVQSLLPFYAFALPLLHLGLYLMGHLDSEARGLREAIVFSGLVLFAVLSLAQQFRLERAVESLRSDLMVRALDDRLRQSQRLESIGRLAGGIAHDFNNLLMVIKSYAELAVKQLPTGDRKVRDRLTEIDRATDRAADLVRQLLAFGRRQVIKPEVVNVNQLVLGLEGMLSRIIGDDIQLLVDLDCEAGFIRVDPALLEQVIVNLAVNARDAMPRGGELVIGTRSVTGSPSPDRKVTDEQRSVELAVSDTGDGIDPAIRDRIFEPYFTTKEMEKGTGLGLATVYGIVEQSGGVIEIESGQGIGSTFRVRLAQVEDLPPEILTTISRSTCSVSGATVLLTEDESNIRTALAEYLESLGLEVLQAENGVDALDVAAGYKGTIDLLLTDLVMPRMSGPELAHKLLAERAGLKVIFVSGYTPEAMHDYGVPNRDAVFIQKPFLLGDLANTIRELLDD
jgi:signal transduction histidine kinase/CheY-like chemotaxis protein